MKTFTLGVSTKSGSYSHTIHFRPLDTAHVEVRRFMRDELMGNWAGDHGQAVVVSTAEARAEYKDLLNHGYQAR